MPPGRGFAARFRAIGDISLESAEGRGILIYPFETKLVRAARGTGSFSAGESVVVPVLIVENSKHLGLRWAGHLAQFDLPIILVQDLGSAFEVIGRCRVSLLVLDLAWDVAAALALSDYTAIRQPWAPVIFMTPGLPWADGDLLIHARNACAILGRDTPPKDLAAMVSRHAATEPTRSRPCGTV